MLTLLEQYENDLLGRVVTMDKWWYYMYDPETEEITKKWKHSKSRTSEILFTIKKKRRQTFDIIASLTD